MTEQPKRQDARAELDRITLTRARMGDSDARRALVERYQTPVFAMLTRMLVYRRGRAVVEELAQETFLRVFGALSKFDVDGPAQLSTWILTIASRLAIDELRKPALVLGRDALFVQTVDPVAAANVERLSLARQLALAVAELPVEQRQTFLLFAVSQANVEEIAKTLGVEIGTVKSRLSRARETLRAHLTKGHAMGGSHD